MRIVCRTNLDAYRSVSWPVLDVVPRKGEYIMVHPGSESYCVNKGIPNRLEVKSVYYHFNRVELDLWYNETDYQLYGAEKLMNIH